ncbi:MAG: hypothetical protein D3904_13520 [Candidatus Electrothrix sp. EH2]|nr:hypothetical protein [Candidatus Electrothrix sp. EH2]
MEKKQMNNVLLATKKTTDRFSLVSIVLISLYLLMNSTNVHATEMTADEQKCLETAIDTSNQSEKSKELFKAWQESGTSCQERDAKIFSEYTSYTMKNIDINQCLSSRMLNDFASLPTIQMQMLDTVQKKLESDACSR